MNGQLSIDQMYAFIVVDDDGTEGVPAIQGPTGPMPLMGADMDRVKSLEPYVESVAKQLGKPVTLARFSTRENVKTYPPE